MLPKLQELDQPKNQRQRSERLPIAFHEGTDRPRSRATPRFYKCKPARPWEPRARELFMGRGATAAAVGVADARAAVTARYTASLRARGIPLVRLASPTAPRCPSWPFGASPRRLHRCNPSIDESTARGWMKIIGWILMRSAWMSCTLDQNRWNIHWISL